MAAGHSFDAASRCADFRLGIKLANCGRLLRLTEPQSGLSPEKRIDAEQPLVREKERLLGVFLAALEQAELPAA